ncbi:MAG TPA: carboxypeptidase regulatory-like domain-containing protein [Alloacidobacterium sp.]|nr:carboxypeptidase regulatory-like domain-containing protein [Alloacidobacterium sp.]
MIATNANTGLVKSSTTNERGEYRIQALPIGSYSIQVTRTGFKNYLARGIVLTVNETHEIDITLEVGSTEEQVFVSADRAQVETTDTQLGQVVDEKQLEEMPLNGRSFLDLLTLQPGVNAMSSPGNPSNDGAGTVSVNGQREQGNGFLINGGDVSGGANFQAAVQPNLDSIAEFKLITNSFDAEYGRFSGSIMNTVTKSGTNSIHGTLFEFLRNDALDSYGYFDNKKAPKGALKKNQFGYAVGGPAIKNKLFWFTDYQGDRQVNGGTANTALIPTMDQRQGNVGVANLTGSVSGPYWAQVLSQRLGTTVTDGEPYSSVFPNGVIPTSAFSPAAVGTLGFIPEPNVTGNAGYNYASLVSIDTNEYKLGQKVDFQTKRTGNWSAYYNIDDTYSYNPYGGGANSFITGFGSAERNRSQFAVLSNTYTVGANAVNIARLSYTRPVARVSPVGKTAPSLGSMGFVTNGLGIIPALPGYVAVPNISTNNFGFGDPGTSNEIQNTYAGGDSFSLIHGAHTLKFGADYRYYQLNNRNGGGFVGSFNFTGGETGLDIADYLLGAPTTFVQSSPAQLDGRSKYASAFAQDSIKVRPNVTMNAGLRWEYMTPWYDTQNKIETLNPGQQSVEYPGAPIGNVYPGDPGVSPTLGPSQSHLFAPRFGLAYSPGFSDGALGKLLGGPGKTSLRIGSGIFYNAVQDQTLYWIIGELPFSEYWGSSAPPLFEEPYRSRATGASQGQKFPFVPPVPGSAAAKNFNFQPYLPISYQIGYDIHNKQPYSIDYNFTIQRELTGSTIVTLGYVGVLSRHMISLVEANPGDPNLCMSLTGSGVMAGTLQCGLYKEDSTFTKPDGTLVYGTRGPLSTPNAANNAACNCDTFGTTFLERNASTGSYNALEVSLEKRSGHYLTFDLSYTWSKALDDASFFNQRINYANPKLSMGLSNNDVAQKFTISPIFVLPFDKLTSRAPWLVKGWAITDITFIDSGFPVSTNGLYDQSLRGTSGLDNVDFSGSIKFNNPRNVDSLGRHLWMSTQGFSVPALGSFGNRPPRFFHGPGYNTSNMALHKDTQITERVKVQFRAEFFNVFNHAQFALPNGYLSGGSFGVIKSVLPNSQRIGQLGLKLAF